MTDNNGQFKPFYPDVLGAVTNKTRINMEQLQFALGVFPTQAFINQPFEAVILLQSMVSAEMQVKVALRLPTTDRKGNVAVVDTPKNQIALNLSGGEVGVLRMPIVARPPTRPGKEFPLRVAVRFRAAGNTKFVRPPGGGAPPSVLEVSPFKLQVLRDVGFDSHTWNESAEIVTTYFDLAPKRIPNRPQIPKPRYESLWTRQHMAKEIKLAKARIEDARQVANVALHGSAYPAFAKAVEERFASRDMPLHPGESMAIAKMMAYTVDEAPLLEPDKPMEETRWFLALCQVLAHDPELLQLDRQEILAEHVFDEVLYESILMGFRVIEHKVKENLGDEVERRTYAERVISWLAGRGGADLNYIYLPLVLGGVAISRLVRYSKHENPWMLVDNIEEASRGRVRLATTGETVMIFHLLDELLETAKMGLRSQRIERT